MKEVGIFEAKTKLTSLCDEVVRGGEPILIRKRGHPMVVLSRAQALPSADGSDILSAWENWQAEHPSASDSDFPEVWNLRSINKANPLAE